ncbi:Vacuolar fusion protein MON1 [Cynara cardunculus var. scolymus]|uniref:Vacuolar fusion protein MON1 homolog n=1 Tax=Cynara cardunculus var. scolymus TaxID=59895 RepID=A0A124SHE9_CYNCS|nr:Vacuolar fusion protein MON1 [Cynara cardunculus var. scolymus]
MTSDSSSSSSSSSEEESAGQRPDIDHNTDSIGNTLDAIENQLSSMALNTAVNEEMPSVADDHHQPATEVRNGSLKEIESERLINSTEESKLSRAAGMWRNNSEVEIDGAMSSPCISGYAAERGSGGGATRASGADDIQELRNNSSSVGEDGDSLGSAKSQWVPGKRHVDEDDASVSWRERKKHFFVLSHSGKPIYSRYGDEHKLAGFSATLQAIISFVKNGGDQVKLVRAGKHQVRNALTACTSNNIFTYYSFISYKTPALDPCFVDCNKIGSTTNTATLDHNFCALQVVFLVKEPIYLVCISCTEEPYESLWGQLELLYGQMVLILTKSVNRCFEKNSKFDMTPLLGGTDVVFSSLFHSFSWNPATFLHAYTCLPLPYATRQAAGAILQDVADSGVLFTMLMCKYKVVSLVGTQKASLHPDDMLLLANFIMSSESFRQVDTYLVLLTSSSDAFFHLKDCRIRIEMVLLKSHVLSEIQRSLLEGGMRVEDLPVYPSTRSVSLFHLNEPRLVTGPQERLHEAFVGIGGPAGLWHFIYRNMYLDQYVSSEFSSPITGHQRQKRLYRAYQKLYASMHDKGTGPHKTQFKRNENFGKVYYSSAINSVLLCWVTQDFELYAAFDPLADKGLAIRICNRVCQWVKDVENEIFLVGGSPSVW